MLIPDIPFFKIFLNHFYCEETKDISTPRLKYLDVRGRTVGYITITNLSTRQHE